MRIRKRARPKEPTKLAILDMETDPFDNVSRAEVFPFLAILHGEDFESIIIWCEDWQELIARVKDAIENLPGKYIIYAHNGGRFDYMFLISQLRGTVQFKGRGIMRATIGNHQLRDSYHIIPEKLSTANKKDDIDYALFVRGKREAVKAQIIKYCLSDCVYTFEIVKAFVEKFGTKMTIGQAAMTELKKVYTFERLGDRTDEYLRKYFMGGRTECIRTGVIDGAYSLFDVHSMYPDRMANIAHPIGSEFLINDRITSRTAFITLRCRNPKRALCARAENGDLTFSLLAGEFHTTIHEYNVALKYKLISDVQIIRTVEFHKWTDFSKFIVPIYDQRQEYKVLLHDAAAGKIFADEYKLAEWKRESLFLKLLANNSYGKFAQNPRRFREHYITQPGERPPVNWLYLGIERETEMVSGIRKPFDGDPPKPEFDEAFFQVARSRDLPEVENDQYWIWSHQTPEFRFNNVATAASITGAARAKLLEAMQHADDPLYCDTDSLICRGFDDTVYRHDYELGAWNKEADIETFIGNGKKTYAYRKVKPEGVFDIPYHEGQQAAIAGGNRLCPYPDTHENFKSWGKGYSSIVVKSKGMNNVTWNDMLEISGGGTVRKTMIAPTIQKTGKQEYLTRDLRKTTTA